MYLCALFLFVFLAHSLAREPHCSKFSYDEALLEKMIRTEVKFEQFQSDFTVLREDVRSTMKQMTTDFQKVMDTVEGTLKEIQRERKTLHNEIETMSQTLRAEVDAFMKTSNDVFEQKKRQIERMSTDLRDFYTDLPKNMTDSLATPVIGFKATDVATKDPSVGQGLVFPTVLFNAGDGYNPDNGIFTAPVSGLYLLTVQICVQNGKYMTMKIMVDEHESGRCFVRDYQDETCNTADAIVYMNARATAYIKVHIKNEALHTDSVRQVSFSGALLNKGE